MPGNFDPRTKHFAALKVLIVDDQALMRELISSICVSIGFQSVEVCDTGQKALQYLQIGKFDLAIIDEQLQAESGLRIIRTIRSIRELASVRVLLITASRDHQIAMAAKGAGADDFMLKPFTPEGLKDRLLRLLPASLAGVK